MDERDKDLTHLFVRDLDEIPLPPRGERRRAQRRETIAMRSRRYLLTAGAIVAVLAIALIAGFQLRDRNATVANPNASPRPEITSLPIIVRPSPTSGPNPTTMPGGDILLDDRFGFIVNAGGGFAGTVYRIQTETGTRIGEFSGYAPAVSPDGRQVAYWQAGGPGAAAAPDRSSQADGNPDALDAALHRTRRRQHPLVARQDGARHRGL